MRSEGDVARVFHLGDEGEVWVWPRCPKCGRYIKIGVLRFYPHVDGKAAEFPEAHCSRCGKVEPDYDVM